MAGAGVTLASEATMEFIVMKAADLVDQRVIARAETRARRTGFTMAVLGLIGLGTFTSIIDHVVGQNVDEEIASITEDLRGDLDREIAYQQLLNAALALRNSGEGFQVSDRDAAMRNLRRLARDPLVLDRPGLANIIEDIVDAFISASLGSVVDEVDQLYRPVLVSHGGTAVSMLTHYGYRLLMSPTGLSSLPEIDHARFEVYSEAAAETGWPEMRVLFEALVTFEAAGREVNEATTELVAELPFLSEADKESFGRALAQRLDVLELQQRPTREGERLVETAQAFVAAYPEVQRYTP